MRRFARIPPWLLVLVVVALASGACGSADSAAKRAIVSANDLQDSAALAYNEAKARESDAGAACAARATTIGPTPSLEICEALGIPIPYNPDKLAALAGPINGAYDAIRAANGARLAVKAGLAPEADLAAALSAVADALVRLYEAGAEMGILNPTKARAFREAVTP